MARFFGGSEEWLRRFDSSEIWLLWHGCQDVSLDSFGAELHILQVRLPPIAHKSSSDFRGIFGVLNVFVRFQNSAKHFVKVIRKYEQHQQ